MLPFVARNQWLEQRNQELLNEKVGSDQKRIAVEKKLGAITLEMKETLIAFESRTMALTTCEEELRIKTLETRRNFPTADIYDAIQSLGDRMEDGMHHFNNLAASKNRIEQAVKRWEAMYCEPTIKIIKLQAHVHAEKEKHRKEYSRQMKVLNENAEKLKQSAARHVTIARTLRKERAVFDQEQEKWRMQKTRELEGTELEAVQELWLSTQEERVKAEVKTHIRAECAKAQEEGRKAGYVAGIYDGVKKGHLEGQVYAATIWKERVTSAEKASRNNSYSAGRAQGHADGRREGYNVGISDGWHVGLAAGKEEGARERGETNEQSYERGRDEGHTQRHYEGYAKGFAQGLDAVEQEKGGTA